MSSNTSVSSFGQRSVGSRAGNSIGAGGGVINRTNGETSIGGGGAATIANGRVVLGASAFKSPILPTPTSNSIYGTQTGANRGSAGMGNQSTPAYVYNGQGSSNNVPPPPPMMLSQAPAHQPPSRSGPGLDFPVDAPRPHGLANSAWARLNSNNPNEGHSSSTISSAQLSVANAARGNSAIGGGGNQSPGNNSTNQQATTPSSGAAALAAIGEDAVRNAATLFHAVKDLRLRLTTVNEESLERAFEAHVANVLRRLDQRLVTIADTRHRRVESAMAKHGLVDASFQQLILLASAISPALGDVVKSLRSEHSELLNEMQSISLEYVEEVSTKRTDITELEAELANMQSEIDNLMNLSNKLDKEADDNQQLIVSLRERLRAVELDKVAVSSGNIGNTSAATSASNSSNNNAGKQSGSGGRGLNTSMGGGSSSSMGGSLGGGAGTKQMNTEAWLLSFRLDMQKALDTPHRCRALTLNECREQVLQLFDLKATANAKAQKSALVPIDTMELFTYKTMEKRYGLRSLAVEHSGALLTAVQRYCAQDFDVLLYSKMFHNEVEEEFREVLEELKRSVVDLLRVQLMARHPSKDQMTINAMISERINGMITAEEWTDIISYLYNSSDSKQLGAILQQKATGGSRPSTSTTTGGASSTSVSGGSVNSTTSRPRSASAGPAARQAGMLNNSTSTTNAIGINTSTSSSNMDRATEMKRFGYTRTPTKARPTSTTSSPRSRVVLAFQDFLRCVLDFQLRNHEAFLGRFVRMFRLADTNSDGFVTPDEFYHMYTQLRVDGRDESQLTASEIDDLNADFEAILAVVDPHGTNRITFSFAAANLSRIGARVPHNVDFN